jgi:hypothetical protein
MKLHFLFSLTFLFSSLSALCDEVTTRSEVEAKLAYEFSSDLQAEISQNIQRRLSKDLGRFHFESKIGPCQVDKVIKNIYFEDQYFDTSNDDLLKNNSIYRIRSRFKPYLKWLIQNRIGSFNLLNPHRVEAQFKDNYIKVNSTTSRIDETRFEVDINSEHSYEELADLPHPLGTIYFKEKVGAISKGKPLKAVYRSLTKRSRFHINCLNPWGSGANPNQVFLISVDRIIHLESDVFKVDRLGVDIEVEVELERNISSRLEEFTKLNNLNGDPTLTISKNYSAQIYSLLKIDLGIINKNIQGLILNLYKKKPLQMKSKYKRMREKLSSVK